MIVFVELTVGAFLVMFALLAFAFWILLLAVMVVVKIAVELVELALQRPPHF